MTSQELINDLLAYARRNPDFLHKEILVVDHAGSEIGIVKCAISTSHWPQMVFYTREKAGPQRELV